MGKRSTIKGYWRQLSRQTDSSTSKVTPAVVPSVLQLDRIAADFGLSAGILSGKWLPKGAVVFRVDIVGLSISGGTTPAIDIGLELSGGPDDNGLVAAGTLPSDAVGVDSAQAGALLGTEITEDVEVTYTDASVTQSTAGTIDVFIHYHVFGDDGKVND